MKRLLLFLALAIAASAQTTVRSGNTTLGTSGNIPVVDTAPDYYLYWDTQTDNLNYGGASPASPVANYLFGAGLQANPYDSNNLWFHTSSSAGFSIAQFWNNSNVNVWGETLGKGEVSFRWMYDGTFVSGPLMCQIGTKSQLPAYDGIAGIAIRQTTNASLPAIQISSSGASLNLQSPAAGVEYRVTHRWNRVLSNPNTERTFVLYAQRSGYATLSCYNTGVTTQPDRPVWHVFQPGNDVTTAGEQYSTDWTIERDPWLFDLPVNIWQDFEFTTVSQANLEANDHNAAQVWAVTGTAGRLTTSTTGNTAMPNTVNLYTDGGTRQLAFDLTLTAQNGVETVVSSASSDYVFGGMLTIPTLTASTNNVVSYVNSGTLGNPVYRMKVRNAAGQHQLYLTGTADSAGSVDVTAGTKYWITSLSLRNGTCRVRVYDLTTGLQVGSEVTTTGFNQNTTNIGFGCDATSTTQSGQVVYWDNLVFDSSFYPLIPWSL